MADLPRAVCDDIVRAGRRLDHLGLVPATAGNISRRWHEPGAPAGGRIAITRSGGHKGFLETGSVIEVDATGRSLAPECRPSAETLLHCQIYRRFADAEAVLHGHSVAGTVLSMRPDTAAITMSGYEMFKVFDGQTTHDTTLSLPVFDNDQDIFRLSQTIEAHLIACPLGYYLKGHGVYVWGSSIDSALARIEALEFLLTCELARFGIN